MPLKNRLQTLAARAAKGVAFEHGRPPCINTICFKRDPDGMADLRRHLQDRDEVHYSEKALDRALRRLREWMDDDDEWLRLNDLIANIIAGERATGYWLGVGVGERCALEFPTTSST